MKRIIPILAASAVICSACTKEINENGLDVRIQNTLEAKLVGETGGTILPGSVLVKLDAETTAQIVGGGFTEISEGLFGDIEIKSFSPAIPCRPKNMEVAKKYGLDRWFTVTFDEETRPQTVAARLAESPAVRSVQYSRQITPIWSDVVYPAEEMPATKASDEKMLFNDPFSVHQWNLYNDGTISETAVAGADAGVKDAWRLTGGDPSVIVAIFDCGLAHRHEDLEDTIWKNEAEINGKAGVDDDNNGFIDDKYGFNFVNCVSIDEGYVNDMIGKKNTAVKGNPIDATSGMGHGMHVAGIVGATNGNGKGISSVAGGTGNGDGVRLMSCQIYDKLLPASDAQRAAAFIYAADNGACIAQCSYGNTGIITDNNTYIKGDDEKKIDGSPLEYAALQYFLDKKNSNHESLEGNIAVFAAGNNANPYSMYPGALSEVLSVTAFGYDFLPGGYTHYGPGCKIAAPGGEFQGVRDDNASMILSLGVQVKNQSNQSPGVVTGTGQKSMNYVYMQGTSMACPHVSGVLALGISYAKKLGKRFSREDMTSLLLSSVNDIDQYTVSGTKKFYDSNQKKYVNIPLDKYHGKMGTGAVDAWKFLMAIEGTPSVIVKSSGKSSIDLSDFCSPSGNYEISVDDASKASLGLKSDPVIRNGKIEIECSKVGAGKIILKSSVGKDTEIKDGIGGMDYSREISIVSREFATINGGLL